MPLRINSNGKPYRSACLDQDKPASPFRCTLRRGHRGDHMAKGASGKIYHTWKRKTKKEEVK
jgi:hypothetical protein